MSESSVPPEVPADATVAEEPAPVAEPAPAASEPVPPAAEPAPGWDAGLSGPPSGEALAERPEVLVGAAFAGGVLSALILKRLAR